ncbi:MAG: aminotransferase class V-fold PLP-dependent enzyme [Alphaproteobacteria bacterium]|jgi:alanine-glyoxylate transaminase/serine-glyoxylate transaminase/serine-pyruvate transaminase|nr:aminotransferase class V-fold PLP-dependent enzyme [Alphaproteobacteria bacterium]
MTERNAAVARGRQFLHTPGPTMMPSRILRAMDRAALDHRGPEFRALAARCLAGLKDIYRTASPVVIFPSAGHGAWEAALVNTLAPGERVLMAETGAFSHMWKGMAESYGIAVTYLPGDWRHGADPQAVGAALADDTDHAIKAVAIVHNETSTGITSRLADIRAAIDDAHHPALLMVDTISSAASIDFRMDDWGVDVAVGGSQKGLMLPPGLSFNAIGEKAWAASQGVERPRNYFDWRQVLPDGANPTFPCTPAMTLMFGLAEALDMLEEEGLDTCLARHARLGGAVRAAIAGWGFELVSKNMPEHSNSVSAFYLPDGQDADAFRKHCLAKYNLVLAGGLMELAGRVVRIGHLGDLNEAMILGTLATTELALGTAGIPHTKGGVAAAIDFLAGENNG